jgi:hypothetical protein
MARKYALLCLFMLAGWCGYAQTSTPTEPVVGKNPLLREVTILRDLSDQVNADHELMITSKSSRSAGEQLTDRFRSSLETYRIELNKQVTLSQPLSDRHMALTEELNTVKQILDELPSPKQTR